MQLDLKQRLERLARRLLNPVVQTRSRRPVDGPSVLRRQNEQFRREIREVVPGVHVALGYGLANSILVEGESSVFLVDALESDEAARDLEPHWARIAAGRPVEALVYTHNHTDHIYGSATLAGDDARVYAHRTTRSLILKIAGILRPIIYTRSMRQFGALLEPGDHLNSGIGPELRLGPTTSPRLRWPTHTVDDRQEVELAGRMVVLQHAPGETPDHLYAWLPDSGVLIPGDNYYHTFPNLYAIRGTAYRDVLAWADSVDRMLSLDAEVLIPCHTLPVSGAKEIKRRLTNYRDAILYVHDQTVRWMNRGLTPDEIVPRVQLPPHLIDEPYLQELYGRVDWSVRSIFAGYLGWFDGDAKNLHPLPPDVRGRKTLALAGGRDTVVATARVALEDDPQWALELAGHLLAVAPDDADGRTIRAAACRALAAAETSANGRNYYLTQAREAEGSLPTPRSDPAVSGKHLIADVPISMVLRAMATNLEAERAIETSAVLGLDFDDTGEAWTLELRRGVCLPRPRRPETADVRLRTTSLVFKEMLVGIRSPAPTLASPDVAVEGSTARLVKLLLLFNAK